MRGLFHLPEPPFCKREALRYAGCREENGETRALLDSAWEEAQGQLSYRACCLEFPLKMDGAHCDLSFARVQSRALSRHLSGCESILLMGATVGIGVDRLIGKYSKISPARALMMQSIGAERIEALCDAFCEKAAEEMKERGLYLTPRFSPGYGDLPLELQKDIFRVLGPERHIGLTLNDSLIMSPSKSVTAIVGLTREKKNPPANPCRRCGQRDCPYRKE